MLHKYSISFQMEKKKWELVFHFHFLQILATSYVSITAELYSSSNFF